MTDLPADSIGQQASVENDGGTVSRAPADRGGSEGQLYGVYATFLVRAESLPDAESVYEQALDAITRPVEGGGATVMALDEEGDPLCGAEPPDSGGGASKPEQVDSIGEGREPSDKEIALSLTREEAERMLRLAQGNAETDGDYPPEYGSPAARLDDATASKLKAAIDFSPTPVSEER